MRINLRIIDTLRKALDDCENEYDLSEVDAANYREARAWLDSVAVPLGGMTAKEIADEFRRECDRLREGRVNAAAR